MNGFRTGRCPFFHPLDQLLQDGALGLSVQADFTGLRVELSTGISPPRAGAPVDTTAKTGSAGFLQWLFGRRRLHACPWLQVSAGTSCARRFRGEFGPGLLHALAWAGSLDAWSLGASCKDHLIDRPGQHIMDIKAIRNSYEDEQ